MVAPSPELHHEDAMNALRDWFKSLRLAILAGRAEFHVIQTDNCLRSRLLRWADSIKRRSWMRRFHDSIDIGPFN
jgi:hypothetical protein